MKLIQLHKKNIAITYKNSICSIATFITVIVSILSIALPIFITIILNPYSAIPETVTFYEKPAARFQFQSILAGETEADDFTSQSANIICSNVVKTPKAFHTNNCGSLKYWSENLNNNGILDKMHFAQDLNDLSYNLSSVDWALFMELKIMRKCSISIPTILILIVNIPQMRSGKVIVDGELQLKQNTNFICPSLLYQKETQLKPLQRPGLLTNITFLNKGRRSFLLFLQDQLKLNPVYFHIAVQEILFEPRPPEHGLTIQLDLNVINLPIRYKLSMWKRLGPIWLYAASLLSLFFYMKNKLKNFLFSKHIIQSCKIVPWKKLN